MCVEFCSMQQCAPTRVSFHNVPIFFYSRCVVSNFRDLVLTMGVKSDPPKEGTANNKNLISERITKHTQKNNKKTN